MASSTRARVSRLTCELEFNTREIVPMPTEAARATSRIVVFFGTTSMANRGFVTLSSELGRSFLRASLAQQNGNGCGQQRTSKCIRCMARSQKTDERYSFDQDSDLTGGFSSVRVWNQFQAFVSFRSNRGWSLFESSGVMS